MYEGGRSRLDCHGGDVGGDANTLSRATIPGLEEILQEAVKLFEEASARDSDSTKPKEPPVLPMQPLTPEELKRLADLLLKWLENYGIRGLLAYDADGDGKLSYEELKRYLQDLIPCYRYGFTCEDREALIEKYLKRLLCGGAPSCDPTLKKITLEDVIDLLNRLISLNERFMAACDSRPEAEREACRKPYREAIEALKKARELIEEQRRRLVTPVPQPTVSP